MTKEYPQPECTNCTGTGWCVCSKCRNNTKIVERLLKMLKQTKAWTPKKKSFVEEHDKRLVLQTLRYAITGKTKSKLKRGSRT